MASWQGFINAIQSPGKLAGFLDKDAATIKPLMALQACLTCSAHSVASFAFSEAQAATKGSRDLEQYASNAVTWGAPPPELAAGGGGGALTPTFDSTAAIRCSNKSRTFWSSCVPDILYRLFVWLVVLCFRGCTRRVDSKLSARVALPRLVALRNREIGTDNLALAGPQKRQN